MELSSIGGFCIKRHHNQNIKCGDFCGSLVKRGKKQKTANSSRISGLFVVPLDYLLVLFLNEPWKKFNATGSSGIVTFTGTPIYGSFGY